MVDDLIDSLAYAIKSCQSLLDRETVLQEKDEDLTKEIEEKKQHLVFIKGAKEKYTIAVNELYEESIVALKDTLNIALKYVMFDKNYTSLSHRVGKMSALWPMFIHL